MPTAKLLRPDDVTVRELRHIDAVAQVRLAELDVAAMPLLRLKRTGARPLLFNGRTVATVCGVTPLLPFWYEINVHRTLQGRYVSDIRLFHKSPYRSDLFWVAEHDELDEAIAHLERFDPVGDVLPPQQPAAESTSSAELALWIARLQLQVHQATEHYRTLAGELLAVLTPKD